jgi:hypothetical protein
MKHKKRLKCEVHCNAGPYVLCSVLPEFFLVLEVTHARGKINTCGQISLSACAFTNNLQRIKKTYYTVVHSV